MMLHLFILHEEQEIEKCLYIGDKDIFSANVIFFVLQIAQ